MKVIISPAKVLEENRVLPTKKGTQPQFLKEAIQIKRIIEKLKVRQTAQLMKVSIQLSDLNHRRYLDFDESNKTNRRPAMYLYGGGTYIGLDAYTIPLNKIDVFQKNLRIISGLYGLLQPLDLIQPYRLEMKVKLEVAGRKDLYDFWTKKITSALDKDIKNEKILLNLASKEYSEAIDFSKLNVEIISPVFMDFKNNSFKVISYFAKEARGSMARYVIENGIESREEILGFNERGYLYSEDLTKKENEPVFVR